MHGRRARRGDGWGGREDGGACGARCAAPAYPGPVSTSGAPSPVPPSLVVRNKALAVGAAGWIEDLPELVARMERDWRITVGRPYDDATEAFVARATLADGTPAVLKLMIPRPDEPARHEIAVLRLTEGDGCVRLLRSDETRGALLLERLGRPLEQLGLPTRRRHEILCAVARRVWRPAAGSGLPTGAEKGRRPGIDWPAVHLDRLAAGRPRDARRCRPRSR